MMYAEVSYHDLYWRIPRIENHVELTYTTPEENEITAGCKEEIISFILSELQKGTKNLYLHIGLDDQIEFSDFHILLDCESNLEEFAEEDSVNSECT